MLRFGTWCVLMLLGGGVTAGAQNTTTRVSVSAAGQQGSGLSIEPAITPDGRYVAFVSDAANFVPADNNGLEDIFVRDRMNGTILRANVTPVSSQAQEGIAEFTRRLAPTADSSPSCHTTNLVFGDTNDSPDIFVRDRSPRTPLASACPHTACPANAGANLPAISGDGRYVVLSRVPTTS